MVPQFIRLRFKNAAGTVQTFNYLGVSIQAIYFDSFEVRDIEIINPLAPQVSVTVGGNAAAVINTTGYKARFTLNLDNPRTLEAFDRLNSFVNIDRFTVELSVMQGNFNWSSGLGGYALAPASFFMDCLLEFDPMNHRKPSFGRALAKTSMQFVAHQTTIFTLPVAVDVIAQAPSGGGN